MLKKILLPLATLLLCLGTISACTTKTFHAETIVAAGPDAVWNVLTDTASYPEWNPVFVAVDGRYVEGTTVTNSVRFPGDQIVAIDAVVEVVAPDRELRQSGGIPGFLTFRHQWLLEPTAEGTKVIQHEVDRGIYLWFWDSSWVEPAYQETLEALKARVAEIRG